ncbi:MAG: amidohydrolase family protein [Myxococcota bacterium]|nr:amidohydrolase family protein [Myxococcota bacterium]
MTGGAIDTWCNAFTPDREAIWRASLRDQGVPLRLRGAERDGFAEPGEMVARMDEHGIATLVLPTCALPPHAGPRDFESVACRPEEVAGFAVAHPGRFAAAWSLDPHEGMAGVERAARALESPETVALHIHTHSFGLRFDAPDYYPFYALAAERGVPVVVQAGSSGGLMPSECGRPIGIDRPALYFSGVSFVLSHTGWPWVDEAVAMALKFPNVYLGCATWPPRRWPAAFLDFVRGPGRSKALFGSGFPLVAHSEALAQLRDLALGDTEPALLEHNARRAFGTFLPNGSTSQTPEEPAESRAGDVPAERQGSLSPTRSNGGPPR